MDPRTDTVDVTPPLYAAVPGQAFTLGNTEVAFHVHADGAVHVMSAEVERALSQCRAFRTLDDHVAAIVQRNAALASKRAAVKGVLEHLVNLGVMVPARDLVRRLGRDVPSEPGALRAVLVRDAAGADADALAASLRSAVAHERACGASRRWAVLGDAQSRAKPVVEGARADGLDVVLIDPSHARRLFGDDDAGALDLALLLGAGARIAQADAATRFEFRRAPGAREALVLPRAGGLPLHLAATGEEARADGEPAGDDPIATAARWCGRTLGGVVAAGLTLDMGGVPGHVLGRPALEPDTRVIGVDFAVRGAPRDTDAAFPWNLRGEPRDRLWRSRDEYESQRRRPCILVRPMDVRAVAGVATLPFMLDGSSMLPPTLGDGPAGERLFGALLRLLHPNALVLRDCSTLARDAGADAAAAQVHTPALADLIGEIAHGAASLLKSDDPATRLSRFAMLVRDLGEAPPKARLEVLAGFVAHRRAAHLTQLQNDLDGLVGAPAWWTDALTEAIVATGRPLTAHTTPRLAGWPETLDETACAARLGSELTQFAARCERWPETWARAAHVADEVLAGK